MANTAKYGFMVVQDYMGVDCIPHSYPVAASQTIAQNDPVILNSDGRIEIAVAASSSQLIGFAAHASVSKTVGTGIKVYDDPNVVVEAMASTGALADTYTTRSTAAAFDLVGITGAFYVNTAASAQDLFKCVGVSKDPVTGVDSEVGASQLKYWKISPAAHVYGTIA